MSTTTLYDVLGIKPDADADTIKKSYRSLSKKHHPDTGGDADRFREITEAYEVLSDPDKRAFYDKHGVAPKQQMHEDPERMALIAAVTLLFQGIIREIAARQEDVNRINIVEIARQKVGSDIDQIRDHAKHLQSDKKRLQAALGRVLLKGDGENLLSRLIENEISGIDRALAGDEENIALCNCLYTFLKDYEYKVDDSETVMYGGRRFIKQRMW